MNKRFVLLLCVLVVLFSVGCENENNSGIKRTYLIYMNGSDLETNFGAASADLEEIVSAKTSDKLKIYIYTGGTEKWHTAGINNEYNEIFTVDDNKLVKQASFESRNMGSADTLAEFVKYVYDKEGNSEYNIILWNHGGNSLTGFGKDQNYSKDSLLIDELKSAFKKIRKESNIRFGFIAFDACLMANIEMMYAIGEYADYIVASEEVVPACGFDYKTFFKEQQKKLTTLDNAKLLAKVYFKSAKSEYLSDLLSISVVDTDKIDKVVKAFENALSVSDIGGKQILMFGGKSDIEGYSNMADLLSLFESCTSNEVQTLIDSVNEAVVYVQNGRSCFGACGISIYFPYYVQALERIQQYKQNSFSDVYLNAISEYKGETVSLHDDVLFDIDGSIYECKYCGANLFYAYYSTYAYSEDNICFSYRIRKNNITEEVKIDAVFVASMGKLEKTEQKYLKHK